VLLAMNQDSAAESDNSSPAASGSSDVHSDGLSSSETSPPPLHEEPTHPSARTDSKRLSSSSSIYSHSYQSSVFSEHGGRSYVSHFRQWSSSDAARPTTSGTSVTDSYTDSDEHANDLAAAVGLLSCSFGTPKSGPVMLPADAPPVPPLPAQFLGQKADHLSGSTIRGYNSYIRERRDTGADADIEMVDEEDDDEGSHGHGASRSDEEEEGMFGKMEE